MVVMSGLSGNEIYCLRLKGFTPGELVVGNSVFSMGFVGAVGSGIRSFIGGEVVEVTDVIRDGRQKALERMVAEVQRKNGVGVTGVSSELMHHGSNIEFLSIGSAVHKEGEDSAAKPFSTSADGQELYCQMDSGFEPVKFVFGNVAYSVGIGGNIIAQFRSMKRGEVKEYSEVFNKTRHLALERIEREAAGAGANAVVGIRTSVFHFNAMQEMLMLGTASTHAALPASHSQTPITSDLTNEEMWNLINIGYMPIKLVLGVSVYSLGVVGGFLASLKGLMRGEISELSSLIYDARANAIKKIQEDAVACGADDVVGIKTYVSNLTEGVIEFMAIGTAVKRMDGVSTLSETLPSQAVIKDKDTYVRVMPTIFAMNLDSVTAGV